MNDLYHVLAVMRGTTVDGPGFRTSIYLAGCSHRCEGCQNPSSWDKDGGTPMTLQEILDIVEEEDFDVTLSGGDPLYNPTATAILVDALKRQGRNVWIYTGYEWELIKSSSRLFEAVKEADVLVDGRFIESLHDPDLLFRGSSNQRLVDIQASIRSNTTVVKE